MRVTVCDHELKHLVHRPHEKDNPQLGHSHGHQTPQEDGREHGAAERNGICRESQIKYVRKKLHLKKGRRRRKPTVLAWVFADLLVAASGPLGSFSVECLTSPFLWLSFSAAVFSSETGTAFRVSILLLNTNTRRHTQTQCEIVLYILIYCSNVLVIKKICPD